MWCLQTAELHSPQQVKLCSDFDALIARRYGTSITPPKPIAGGKADPDSDDIDEPSAEKDAFPEVEDIVDSTGKVLNQQPAYDKLIHAEICCSLMTKWLWERYRAGCLGTMAR